MTTTVKPLGVMRPLGGGDPIPLKKAEITIGRRKTSDVRLDFENISGRHCQLRFLQGVWHVRDMNSTNGTTVNGQPIFSEHEVMPDDALGIAGHMFMIDYDPVAPTSLMDAKLILEEELEEGGGRRRSLMEMAGIASDAESSYRLSRTGRVNELYAAASAVASGKDLEPVPKPSKPAPEPAPPPIPGVEPEFAATVANMPMPRATELSDDEFLALIDDDLDRKKPGKKA